MLCNPCVKACPDACAANVINLGTLVAQGSLQATSATCNGRSLTNFGVLLPPDQAVFKVPPDFPHYGAVIFPSNHVEANLYLPLGATVPSGFVILMANTSQTTAVTVITTGPDVLYYFGVPGEVVPVKSQVYDQVVSGYFAWTGEFWVTL